jgi:hypothetical protein
MYVIVFIIDNENEKCDRNNNPTKECKTTKGHPWVFNERQGNQISKNCRLICQKYVIYVKILKKMGKILLLENKSGKRYTCISE